MAMSMSSTYTGVVTAVNDKGLRLVGHTDWFNVSKFAPDIVLPERGATVTVAVDAKGFLRSCEPADPSASSGQASAPVATRIAGASDAAPTAKDRTITRLAVLKAAAEYAASKPESKSTDVLAIAASWERWVLRDEAETTDDLTDAL